MLDQIQGFHIEPTNMCTLKCPRCSRTEFINQFPNKWANKNLNLDNLKNFLDVDLKGKIINICGNYGDAIYYDQLFEMIKYFKQKKAKISLSTNGSYRTTKWWDTLGSLLESDDKVILAIDGLPENFTNYRVNADWASIKLGIDVLKDIPVQLHWQYILFKYNENQIDQAKSLSEELGFDHFFVINSTRWDHGTEYLTPTLVDTINQSKIEWKKNNVVTEVDAKCKQTNSFHYISADGFYTPCCWVAEHRWYYKSEFYKNKEQYNISKTTLSHVLNNLKDFYNTLEDAKLNYCTFNCPKL